MPSETDASRPAKWSLRARVALSSAAVGALVGLASAGTAALLLDRLAMSTEDARLADAAAVLDQDLVAHPDAQESEANDEAAEVAALGLRLALYADGRFVGGNRAVPLVSDGCATQLENGVPMRVCAFGPAQRTIVVMTRDVAHKDRGILELAVVAAAVVAAFLGALASWFAARWALSPMTALQSAIARVSADDPRLADLGTPSRSTDVEALRAAVRALLDRLGDALDVARTFGANAAHELRTPLATTMAELDLLAERPGATLSQEDREALARMRRGLARLAVLVDRLLTLSHPSHRSIRDEAVALDDVVRETVAEREAGERRRIEVSTSGAGIVRGDEVLLRVIVDNLLDNALKFSGDEAVTVAVTETAKEVHLVVCDRGPGISKDDVERLLLPFARGQDVAADGFGLGLAIVAHGARLHGGDVHFAEPELGAEVRVTLPAWSESRREP